MKPCHDLVRAISRLSIAVCVIGIGLALDGVRLCGAEEQAPFGIVHRIPWTTSRVAGSPDPPLGYTVERTFTRIPWKAPIFALGEPDTDRLFVIQQGGEKERPSKILTVHDDPRSDEAGTFLELSGRLIYSVVFHPGYRTNGQLYVFSHGVAGPLEHTNRISRFSVERPSPGRCDPESEHVIIQWQSQGHDGGGIVFGPDGMLYISTGDGTSDSDAWVTGQDVNDLLGGILRLDVDHTQGNSAYSIPRDNPFVGSTNARPEIWAYGLRNPWRLCADWKTGQIWAGNNGQDLWETAHLIRRGENYGWSVYEGSHPFYLNRRHGPTPIVAPTIEHPHADMRSLTGGVVYHGDQLPELDGTYVYGDYSTGQIWGARHDGSRVTMLRQLAGSALQITAFTADHHGGLLVVDHGGGLYRLVRSPTRRSAPRFPTRLSQTGLFTSTRTHQVEAGVIPYSLNAAGWADGASVERFMALSNGSRIGSLSNGTVLVQTFSLEREVGNAASRQRIETRILTRQSGEWAGYSYRWDAGQSDAKLVGRKGEEKEFVIQDGRLPGGSRPQVWHYPSRAECMACHSRAAEFVLGLMAVQLNKTHGYGAVRDNQLRALQHIGVFTGSLPKPPLDMLVDPYDPDQDLNRRARSYLHVNCSVCHVEAGGGNSKMDLRFSIAPEQMSVFGARPQHDTFGVDNAMLIFPGDPDRSVLFRRLSHRGRGQMPPLVSSRVDERAVALFRDWIKGMKPSQPFVREWKVEDLLPGLDRIKGGRSFESGRAAFRLAGCGQCHRFAGDGGSVGPDLTGVARRLSPHGLLESILLPSAVITEGYASTEIETTSGEVITGRIEREDDRMVVLGSLSGIGEATSIRKAEIRRRALSKVSNMPTGIVNTLSEIQILDLLAYLMSDGDLDHSVFRGDTGTTSPQ